MSLEFLNASNFYFSIWGCILFFYGPLQRLGMIVARLIRHVIHIPPKLFLRISCGNAENQHITLCYCRSTQNSLISAIFFARNVTSKFNFEWVVLQTNRSKSITLIFLYLCSTYKRGCRTIFSATNFAGIEFES